MNSVHLDCSSLPHHINLSADQTVPHNIYIDGQDFINKFEQAISQQIYELQENQLSFKERLILALASNSKMISFESSCSANPKVINADIIINQADEIIRRMNEEKQ